MTPESSRRFARVWTDLEAELDWILLGRLHCHEGGDDFFAPEDRAAILDAGLLFADDLSGWLARRGRSLYVGGSVAELVPMLVETLVLERDVLWYERPGPITSELARAIEAVARRTDSQLPRPSTAPLRTVAEASCDHAWLVSVLTDPDAFPALHDELYGRRGALATGAGDRTSERRVAASLVETLLARLRRPALLTTTDEELALLVPFCERRGLSLEVPDQGRLSAVVGDVVRFCRLR